MGPSIEAKKLREYVGLNNSYWLYEHDNILELHFSPEFPEATSHLPEGKSVEHIMYGVEKDGKIYFNRFTTRSAFGETTSSLEDEDDPIMEWLKYI
ncbi:MAG: hypothetical protein M1393_04550 [Candidatus Thermoplasmatota archaeon]|jgi:hypothetical protein|nr:hypothetical protein [Candidatus Thermoplasmatota archaeon]MCL6090291.1 hypothetical protein [Candidatus Thermoplasmatota archaeon]MDA8143318.1 hypothetical protein [Thermoplasmatales archaeon]